MSNSQCCCCQCCPERSCSCSRVSIKTCMSMASLLCHRRLACLCCRRRRRVRDDGIKKDNAVAAGFGFGFDHCCDW